MFSACAEIRLPDCFNREWERLLFVNAFEQSKRTKLLELVANLKTNNDAYRFKWD
jgi:hypothetical protein